MAWRAPSGFMIQSGQRGVLFRWGKAVKELEPGFHWLIPLVHAVKKTPVRSVTIHLPSQKVMTVDGLVYDVSVSVVYRVEDATRALTLVDHVDTGCRAAIPIVVAEVLRVRDQAQLVERVSLDRELSERMSAWIARWGLVVEQAGFTTIAPTKGVLQTTQLRSRTMERARALRDLIDGGPRRRIRPGDDRDRAPSGREVEPILPYADTTTRPGDPRAPGDAECRGAARRCGDGRRGDISQADRNHDCHPDTHGPGGSEATLVAASAVGLAAFKLIETID